MRYCQGFGRWLISSAMAGEEIAVRPYQTITLICVYDGQCYTSE